jgi:CubicO group peptidase (beta-lactamase class C family)
VKKAFLLIIVLICSAGISNAQPKTTEDEIAQLVYAFLDKWNIAGASIAINQNGKTLILKGFGYADKEHDITVDASNLYRIASISKMLTAVTVLKLKEAGKLDLEAKVFGTTGILNSPEYAAIKDKRILQISVRNLMQHTGGWDREKSGDPMFNQQIPTVLKIPPPADEKSIIRYMLSQSLDFSPGTKYSYSNFGYNILGRVIEKVTAMPYEAAVKEYVLNPLGIFEMCLGKNLEKNHHEKEVKYYDSMVVNSCYGDSLKVNRAYGGFNLQAMDAHGGWIASAQDLIRFLEAIDGRPEVPDLLNGSSLYLLKKPSEVCDNYGLGCHINDKDNMWHTGSLYGSSSIAANLSGGVSCVILLNGNPLSSAYFKELDRLMWQIVDKLSIENRFLN